MIRYDQYGNKMSTEPMNPYTGEIYGGGGGGYAGNMSGYGAGSMIGGGAMGGYGGQMPFSGGAAGGILGGGIGGSGGGSEVNLGTGINYGTIPLSQVRKPDGSLAFPEYSSGSSGSSSSFSSTTTTGQTGSSPYQAVPATGT